MIARITGILAESSLTEVIVDVHGIGYALTVPLSTIDKLPPLKQEVTLHTHLNVREDAMQLYGFYSLEELNLFRLLVNCVQGVGPKLAISVLSSMSIRSFCAAVAGNDLKLLSKINGVGKKTAERMVIELRDKVNQLSAGESTLPVAGDLGKEAADAVAALETLGYKREAALKVVEKLRAESPQDSEPSASQLIRKALAILNS